jgi:hypothetical protein
LGAIAGESPLEVEARLRAFPRQAAAWADARLVDELKPAANGDVEPWELHSELVLVCPEVRERARELLPGRDPETSRSRLRALASSSSGTDPFANAPKLPVAVVGYALWRLAETARSALVVIAAVVALAVLAEILR